MNTSFNDASSVPSLLKKLCSHIANNNPAHTAEHLKFSLKFLSSANHLSISSVTELQVISRIRKHLSMKPNSSEDIRNFDLLYSKLQNKVLKNKTAVLAFFYAMIKDKNAAPIVFSLKEIQNINHRSNSMNSFSSSETVQQPYSHRSGFELNTQLAPYYSEVKSVDSFRSLYGGGVPESSLIKEIIYCFQGIEAKIIQKDPSSEGFSISPAVNMTRSQRAVVQRLIEVGYLHNQIRQHLNSNTHVGVIGQSLIAAFKTELVEYYKLVSILQSQLKNDEFDIDQLTLRRLLVWIAEPQLRLQWLANISLECQNKKGGALISSVYAFLQHGAPVVQTIVRRILKAICLPFFQMLTRWLLDGLLEDSSGEFFIECRTGYKEQRLWYDKYHVRLSMLPTFITVEQARKILITGKSINFIREVCDEKSDSPGREIMEKTFKNISVEALFTPEMSIELHKVIEDALHETSNTVLDIMRGQNRLIEHMQAFRRYLLLGQGDFIRCFLELLAPELSLPANKIYPHTLSAILESAIRLTNAKFEHPDTLKRLDVRLMEISPEDSGWEVFTLLYHIDGPIGTIFEPTLEIYQTLFGALWKAKRMEFILSGMWKRQITSARSFRKLTDVTPLMQNIHILTSEMVHFIHQTQYYFLFEVLECSWAEMLNKVNLAEYLDDVIKAHNNFLASVQKGVLVDSSSKTLYMHLCSIYQTILMLERCEEDLNNKSMNEVTAQITYEEKLKLAEEKGETLSKEEEKKDKDRKTKFGLYLLSAKTQIRSIAKQYNDYLRKYLEMLASHSDMNLQLLSVRLDFNSFYESNENCYNRFFTK